MADNELLHMINSCVEPYERSKTIRATLHRNIKNLGMLPVWFKDNCLKEVVNDNPWVQQQNSSAQGEFFEYWLDCQAVTDLHGGDASVTSMAALACTAIVRHQNVPDTPQILADGSQHMTLPN